MEPESGSRKRKALAAWSVADVVAWMRGCDALTADIVDALVARVEENEVDGEVLTTVTEADLESVLGVAKFGTRRKLHARLEALRGGGADQSGPSPSPPTEPAAGAAQRSGGASATPAPAPTAGGSAAVPPPRAGAAEQVSSGPSPPAGGGGGGGGTGAPPRASAAEKGKGPASGSGGGGAAAKPRGDAGAFEAARDPRLARAAKLVDAQLQAEASAVGTLKWVADKFQRLLATEPSWATGPLKAARTAELAALAQKCVLPHSTTVLVGNTGAGKSTLLNALLGEWGVLPTNGMRACTAALMELSFCHDTDGPAYRADVEFYGRREWEDEEEALLADLTGPDGRVALSVSDPNSHLYVSWCKLHAVYGDAFTHSRVVDTAAGRGPDGRARYLNPMADDLKEKLHACRRITGALGTVRHLASDDARVFRRDVEAYCDSSNEHAACSFWPLVRRVRLCSRKWGVLKSGAVLVDAPGVNDDNSARDGIVKAYLRDADAIWIVSNIKRAVNDKAAKTMLGESFRRQLLMDGQYGQLVFVASQSDVLVPSEIADNLRMPRNTPIAELAAARNEFTRQRIQRDFIDGLVEMSVAAGETPDRDALAAAHQLPVFTVSSVDFQKLSGVRRNDGPPDVWSEAEATELPALRRFVHEATLRRRRAHIVKHTASLCAFADAMQAYLEDNGTSSGSARAAAKAAFDAQAAALTTALAAPRAALGAALAKHVAAGVGPQLQTGAGEATKECVATVAAWGASWSRGPGGGLHHGTYAASCRRNGQWKVDMNEALAEPVFRAVSVAWERGFVSGLKNDLANFTTAAVSCLDAFHDGLAGALSGAGIAAARADALRRPQDAAAAASVAAAADKARGLASEAQKEASRQLTPTVQSQMMPAYGSAAAEAGTGSHRRRCGIMERHVENARVTIFAEAIKPVVASLAALQKALDALLAAELAKLPAQLRLQYCSLWDVVDPAGAAARERLRAPMKAVVLEAHRARKRLAAAMAEADADFAGVDDAPVGDDDDVMDVTAAEAAKRKRAMEAERLDLTKDSDDENDGKPQAPKPTPPPRAPAATGSGRVKLERP